MLKLLVVSWSHKKFFVGFNGEYQGLKLDVILCPLINGCIGFTAKIKSLLSNKTFENIKSDINYKFKGVS